MKILVPLVQGRSGNDVYFRRLTSALAPRGVLVESVCFSPALEILPRLASRAFARRARTGGWSVVHANADHGDSFRINSLPFIVTVHHNVFEEPYQRSAGLAQRAYHLGLLRDRLLRALAADRVVAVSHATRASLERSFGRKGVCVIHNGVDPAVFSPLASARSAEPPAAVRLLFVGNLTRRKGADLLPRIMARLGRGYVLSYTAGFRAWRRLDGPNMRPLAVKSVRDLVAAYNACDVFVLPSRLEGFGYAVAEAMACGKPVVCTNTSSLPELVVDGHGGFLCASDNVEEFAERIARLGADAELRARMGEFNRARVLEKFTAGRMADDYCRLYEDCTGLRR